MKMSGKKGQASMELLITLAFVMMMLIPITVLVYLQTSSGTEQLSIDQAQQSVSRLKNAADMVAAQGAPAKTTINIIIPRGLNRTIIGSQEPPYIGREIVFGINTAGGETQIVATTLYNITGDLGDYTHAGTYPVAVEAVDNCKGTGMPCVVISPA